MGTPLGWLERVPTYKDQMEKLADRESAVKDLLAPVLAPFVVAAVLAYLIGYQWVGEHFAALLARSGRKALVACLLLALFTLVARVGLAPGQPGGGAARLELPQ